MFRIYVAVLFTLSAAFAQYRQTNLISDLPSEAAKTDSHLVNPWGIARSNMSPWWVANNGTGTSTIYTGEGQIAPLVVTVSSAPTGIIFNGTSDFAVTAGNPARFIFVTEEGTILGWNPSVNPTNAVIKVDHSASGAIYKGVTMAQNNGANYLYVANFHDGVVEVYDKDFAQVTLSAGAFSDPDVPSGYGPFNVQHINGKIYVAFAKQDEDREDEVAGPGLGFVTAFDPAGNVLSRLESGPWLNAPWAMVLAPDHFREFSNRLLVGNFGSGEIAGFDPASGKFKGLLRSRGRPIVIEGLWGLGFGNDAMAGPSDTLFFAAGIDDESHGLFGTITPIAGAPF